MDDRRGRQKTAEQYFELNAQALHSVLYTLNSDLAIPSAYQ